jgi:hypothetical protein
MKDAAAQPIVDRLHVLVSRLSRDGGYITAQGDVAEAAARITMLERVLHGLLDHIDHVAYHDAGGSRLSAATPAVSTARAVLGTMPRD